MDLLAFFLLYFGLTFVWRSLVVYRKTGINPLVLTQRDDAYGYVGRAFKVAILGIALFVLIRAFWPHTVSQWGAIPALASVPFALLGWGLMGTALLLMLVAQAHMGVSWRIGIDENRVTDLVTEGLFAHSRNPIFLSLRLTLLGLFLVEPCAPSLALALAGEVLMQVQVRLEEAHLRGLHGQRYEAYCQRVRRWL
jgi:protein-S-isoprenylcysteine O-methyltransferase Ste14